MLYIYVIYIYMLYIYITSNSPGLLEDALIYSTYINNSKIINNVIDIIDKDYSLLFLEYISIIDEKYFINSKNNILMVNIDLFYPNNLIKYINTYICKTKFTKVCLEKLMKNLIIPKISLLKTRHMTISKNLYNNKINKNYNFYLHSAGKSPFKNTYLIIMTWLKYKLPKLIVTCYNSCYNKLVKRLKDENIEINLKKFIKHNIFFYNYKIDFKKIVYFKNNCGIHLCPSSKEGYGHYINEGRIVKSVVVTVDGKPMNELVNDKCGYLIPSQIDYINDINYSISYKFKIDDLYKIINEISNTSKSKLEKKGEIGYHKYLLDMKYFIKNINKVNM